MYFFTEWLQFLKKFLIFLLCLKMAMAESGHFLGEWALEVDGGDEVALAIAQKHNFEYLGKIFDNVHHFRHRRLAKRSTKPSGHHQSLLRKEPAVRWAEQQVVKRRVKRDFNSIYKLPRHRVPERSNIDKSKNSAHISDPKWEMMWYLNRGGGLDMNVQSAWKNNVTGKGVVVTILDDGLEKDHPDLIQNYDPHASTDVNGRDSDPMPRYDLLDSNRHGTRCAGEVAAKVNNSVCAVGVAYEASVGGVRMLDGDVTDAVEARSLSFNTQHIDIYSASWGPDDDGKTVDGPGKLATRAFNDGVITGRNGKGSIFVWASGNGGRDQDNCNCDGYTNSIWTLSISSATEQGSVPWYSEACSSTLATTYSSGSVGERQIITTDLHHGCTTTHTGTSASAPLAAGICALALQANKKLTWRDMQHVVVRTARPENLIAPDWQINGVGRKVSHRFGYGLMDANGMVKLARNWTTVPPQRGCEVPSAHVNKVIPHQSSETLSLEVSDCPGVNYLEHVQAKVTLTADRRGDIEIFLISPSGTKSNLLALRQRDNSRNGFHLWPFMTVHMWGESPLGIWKLEIRNSGIFYSNSVVATRLSEWSLVFYGTRTDPDSKATGKRRSSHNDSYDFPKVFSRYPVQPTRPPRPNVLPPFSFDPNGIYPFGALRTTPDNMMTPRPPFDYNRKVHSNFNYGGFPPFLNISKFPVINTFKPSRRPPARPRFNWPYFPLMTSPRTTPKPYRKPLLRDHNGNAQIQNWTLLFHGTEYEPGASVNSDVNHFGKPGVNMIDGNAIEHSSLSPHVTERAKGEVDFGHKDEASRSSSAPRSRPGSEVLGCVGLKNSSGDCLECAASFILHESRCVRSCPLKFYVGKSSTPSSELVCLPCHYSCKTCTGPFDYECVTCWPDALSYAPRKGEQYCRSKSLLEAYNHQSSLLKLVIPLFLLLFFFVLILSFVVFRRTPNRDSPYTFPEDARGSVLKLRPGVPLASTTNSYSPLRIDDRDKLVAGRTFHDHSSEDEIG